MLNNDIGDSNDSDDEESFDDTTKVSSVSTTIVASGKENNDDYAESQCQDCSTNRSNSDEESEAEDLNSENSIISELNPTNAPEMAEASTQIESMLPTLLAIVKLEEDTRGDEDEGEVEDTNDEQEVTNDNSDISGGYQLVHDADSVPEMAEASAQVDLSLICNDVAPVKIEDTSGNVGMDNTPHDSLTVPTEHASSVANEDNHASVANEDNEKELPTAVEENDAVTQDAAAVTEPVDEEEHRVDEDEDYIGDLNAQVLELGDDIEEEDGPCLRKMNSKDITDDANVQLVVDSLPFSRKEKNNNDCEMSNNDQTTDSAYLHDLFGSSMESNAIDEADTFRTSEADDDVSVTFNAIADQELPMQVFQADHGILDQIDETRGGDINETSGVVDALQELARKDIIIAALNDEVADAKYDRQMYLDQSNRFEQLCISLEDDLYRSEAEKEVLAEENENLTKRVEQLTDDNHSLLEELSTTKGEFDACQADLKDSNAKNVALEEELGTVRKTNDGLNKEVSELEGKVSNLQGDLTASQSHAGALQTQLKESEDKNASLENESSALKVELGTVRKERDALDVTVNNVTSEMEEARREVVTLKNQLNQKSLENACLKDVNSTLENEIEEFESELDSAQCKTETVRNELSKANAQISELQREKSKIKKEERNLQTNLVTIQKENDDLLGTVQTLRREKADLEEKLDELEVCAVPVPSVAFNGNSDSIESKDEDDLSYDYSESLDSASEEAMDDLKQKLQHSEMENEQLRDLNKLNTFLSGNPTTMRQLLKKNNELTGALQKLEKENRELTVQNKSLQREDPVDVKSLKKAIAACEKNLKMWKAMLASIGKR